MNIITMKAYKYDGRLHYESSLQLLQDMENLYVLYGPPGRKLIHYTRSKTFTFDAQSIELYFSDRWYTVACVIDLQGEIDYYYCNIAKPCVLSDSEVRFVDMDLDIIVQKDFTYKVIDQEEYEEHQVIFGYSAEDLQAVDAALKSITRDIENRFFPFDGYIDDLIQRMELVKGRSSMMAE